MLNTLSNTSPEIQTMQTDLYDENGILLIAKGMPVTKDLYEKLLARKIARPAKPPAMDKLAVPVENEAAPSEHQIHHYLINTDLFAAAARITQQAIDTVKTNFYLQTHVKDVFLNQPWVYDHSVNVAQLATQIALTLTMPEDEVLLVSEGALLHDIGRSVTENATTSFVLTNDDLIGSSVKHHPTIGSSLLKKAGLPESVSLVALQHHERFSGRGYPRGLIHDAIHLHAQIVMLADVFEALTTRRLKNKTFEIAEGLAVMKRGRGTDYNPVVFDALLKMLQGH